MNLKRSLFLFLTVLLMSAGSVSAQHMNANDAPCRTAGSGFEETQCFVSEAKAADRELNAFYAQIRKVLAPVDQNKLQSAQRLWVQFRDANCAAERDLYEGGSAASMVYAACFAADARQRTAELHTMYDWLLKK
jgi:uncharacterized protein YecT (DUF1311 family)